MLCSGASLGNWFYFCHLSGMYPGLLEQVCALVFGSLSLSAQLPVINEPSAAREPLKAAFPWSEKIITVDHQCCKSNNRLPVSLPTWLPLRACRHFSLPCLDVSQTRYSTGLIKILCPIIYDNAEQNMTDYWASVYSNVTEASHCVLNTGHRGSRRKNMFRGDGKTAGYLLCKVTNRKQEVRVVASLHYKLMCRFKHGQTRWCHLDHNDLKIKLFLLLFYSENQPNDERQSGADRSGGIQPGHSTHVPGGTKKKKWW